MNLLKKMVFPLSVLLPLTFSSGSYAAGESVPGNVFSSFNEGKTAYILSASISPGTSNCGPGKQMTNGWNIDAEALFNHEGVANNTEVAATGGYFSGGTFTAPVNGFYNVSVSARIETQAGDITLRHRGLIVAAFGTDLVERRENQEGYTSGNTSGIWSSHGVSKNIYMNRGEQLVLFYESGRSDDCSIETSFHYGQFNVNLIRATASVN